MCVVIANNIKHFPDSEEKSVSPPKIFYSAVPWGKKMPCAQPGIKAIFIYRGSSEMLKR